jgi:hypothetical protein
MAKISRSEWIYNYAALQGRCDRLEADLEQIRGHLGACIAQRAPSDDAIIFDHIQAAYDLARGV